MNERASEEANKVGAVLVVGGGIGGMQASLDLADSGFKVYLLEEKPSIGGVMAQLDKTFPTNDCAMCIMSPKLVDAGRHPNIELLTYSKLESIKGKAGNFKVKVLKHARYVDLEKCTGCGECEEACPVELSSEFDEGLSKRHAIYRLYPQAIPNVYAIDKLEGKTPCKTACPAEVNAQGYVQLIGQKKFKEALNLIRERNPFPAICGRVCHHPCEEECLRKEIDEAVAIRPLKRFAADYAMKNGEEQPEVIKPTKKEKVAVVGAGPSGLTCALKLLEMGYPVTIFDASDKPGGMMTSCIPEYRIPEKLAMYDINWVLAHGIEIKKNVKVGKDITLKELRNEYEAVYIAVGSQDPAKLKIEGSDLKGVLYGLPFLREVKKGKKPEHFGERIIIIGGGNVGIDCAKSAIRLGAKEVHLVCLETRDLSSGDRMPAHEWEIEEAEDEGMIIHDSLGPKRILGINGKVTCLQTIICTSVYDEERRFSPKFSDDPAPTIEGDTVIVAIGQRPDFTGLEDVEMTPWRTIKADELTLETSIPGVFAGGDITRGPASVVEAVADGNEAAISIDRYLNNEDLREGRGVEERKIEEIREEVERKPREKMPMSPVKKRVKDFCEVELGFTEDAAVSEAKRCLSCSICSECLQCVEACEADAIDHKMQEKILELNVGSIILAPGYDKFEAKIKSEYGYGRYKNVLTSIEFERILSASGPFEGKVVRPFDEKEPRKIAWIQCVGSRDKTCGGNYCSSVCCTYAIKEAVIAKEHLSSVEPTIFYMDMRTYGKGFDAYYERAKDEYGVRFVRCRVAEVQEDHGTNNLHIRYETEDGKLKEEEFDMVVLSVGFKPVEGVKELAEKLGIKLNDYGFCETSELSPVDTTQPGIYACGAFSGPKDIPETVMQASGAAAKASSLISSERNTLVEKKEYPPEIHVEGQEPRIGVFICHCGINIGAYVDVPSVVEYAKSLPNVAYAEDNLYTCSQDTQKKIVETIKEQQLNRVIVASCTPRTHEPLFQETIREAGLNPHLFEMANIRDQCSWVHMKEPESATEKAKDLVRMAVAKARLIEPLPTISLDVIQKGLVIGGGLAGMISALAIAEQGYEVYLIEKENVLGGNLRNIHYTLENEDIQSYLESIIKKVENNPYIKIYRGAQIEKIGGYVGNYKTALKNDSVKLELQHGIIVVATGAQESIPKEYLYGEDERIITQLGLEKQIAEDKNFDKKTIVMIQCVGSRNDEHLYCSRVCCSDAIKNALKLKEKNTDAEVFILYRDMRTYGFREFFYEKAREKGIIFIRYDIEEKPQVKKGEKGLEVVVREHILDEELLIHADLVVLSPAIVPRPENIELAKQLKVPLNEDDFFLEAHVKLRPVDFATEGIFLAGMAHSPKSIDESISQAYAAASRACTIISKKEYITEATIAAVNEDLCSGCRMCEILCEYNAIEIIDNPNYPERKIAKVNEALCKGCGLCSGACPSGAMEQKGFKSRQIMAMIDAIAV